MSHILDLDTICAPATASGSAICVIRISGSEAFSITKTICGNIEKWEDRKAQLCNIYDNSGILDKVIVTTYKAPKSYTGEDCVEISCHGSRYIVQSIITLLTENAARLAKPGEFTQRAFLNGKMDLSQAEAVADLIKANSQSAHHAAISQMRGNLSNRLRDLREELLKLTCLLELELDFSDHEELEFADRKELSDLAEDIENHISALLHSFKSGEAIKEGIPVAIIGETNVGKSTLLNQLLKEERAIVSDIHGTTRDTIEDTIQIHGQTFRFIDTAGLRQTDDEIEQIGIERTYKAIERARIIIWVTDQRPSNSQFNEIKEMSEGKHLIVVHNKADLLAERKRWMCPMTFVSAKNGDGISELEETIYKAAGIINPTTEDIIISSARHAEALNTALKSLRQAQKALKENISSDLVAEDLRTVLTALAEITGGQITSQETLNNIFSNFCVGK